MPHYVFNVFPKGGQHTLSWPPIWKKYCLHVSHVIHKENGCIFRWSAILLPNIVWSGKWEENLNGFGFPRAFGNHKEALWCAWEQDLLSIYNQVRSLRNHRHNLKAWKVFFFKKSFKVIKVLELLGKALEYTYFMYQIHPQLPQCNTPTFCNTTYVNPESLVKSKNVIGMRTYDYFPSKSSIKVLYLL